MLVGIYLYVLACIILNIKVKKMNVVKQRTIDKERLNFKMSIRNMKVSMYQSYIEIFIFEAKSSNNPIRVKHTQHATYPNICGNHLFRLI